MNNFTASKPVFLIKTVQCFLGILALLCLWNSLELFNLSALASRQLAGNWSTDYAEALYHRRTIAGSLQIVWFLLTFILFLSLVFKTTKNLLISGAELSFTPPWAISWFFIPIYNLFKPFIVLKEINSTTNGKEEESNPSWLLTWWILLLLIFLSGIVTAWLLLHSVTPTDLMDTAWYRALQELAQSGISIYMIFVIDRLF